jgi:hypothetical protein
MAVARTAARRPVALRTAAAREAVRADSCRPAARAAAQVVHQTSQRTALRARHRGHRPREDRSSARRLFTARGATIRARAAGRVHCARTELGRFSRRGARRCCRPDVLPHRPLTTATAPTRPSAAGTTVRPAASAANAPVGPRTRFARSSIRPIGNASTPRRARARILFRKRAAHARRRT